MKTTILLAIFSIAITTALFSQRASGGRSRSESDYDPMAKPNLVKLNLTSLVLRNIALQYERVLGNKISVACGLRYMPKGSVPFKMPLDDIFNTGGELPDFPAWKVSSISITPEFRFYPKHAGNGFYFAPYGRFRSMSLDIPIDYTDDNNKAQKINAVGTFNSYIGGIMIGSQFISGQIVTLDWFIVGFHYGVSNGKLDIKTSQTLSVNDQYELGTILYDFKQNTYSFRNIDYTINANGGSISDKFKALGFRAFGLNLGIKF